MKRSGDAGFLLKKLHDTSDYHQRLVFIERNLDQFDASLVTALDELVDSVSSKDSTKCHLAFFRAITLAEIAYVFGKVGDIAAAKQFASYCLRAHQKGLYLGGQIGVDCSKETENLLDALLADTGEFRGFGLEEEAWQGYWIADPICAAMDTAGESVTTGQLLSAAVILEQVGMLERAAQLRHEALSRIGDDGRYRKENAMAKKIVGPPPAELPAPDIYDGLTIETAVRFNSQTVGVRCIQQTRCPKCRGQMTYTGSTSFVRQNGYYRRCNLICQKDQTHPALTLFRNSLLLPGAQIFGGLGYDLDRKEEERLDKSGALLSADAVQADVGKFKPRRLKPRVFLILTFLFLLILFFFVWRRL